MGLEVKTCGLKTLETAKRAVFHGVDYIGFVFFPRSPRYIELDTAAEISKELRGKSKIVAITVDADNDCLDKIVKILRPDLLQLHGNESPNRVSFIKEVFGLPVIKALAIRDESDFQRIISYRGIVDRFLLDAKASEDFHLPGGNGISFDWKIIRKSELDIDYILAGGLNSENIGDALIIARPSGVDVSSGVECAPGIKDLYKMDNFFSAWKKALVNFEEKVR